MTHPEATSRVREPKLIRYRQFKAMSSFARHDRAHISHLSDRSTWARTVEAGHSRLCSLPLPAGEALKIPDRPRPRGPGTLEARPPPRHAALRHTLMP